MRHALKTNSIKDVEAYSVGDITQNFINLRTPCSFSVFKQMYTDAVGTGGLVRRMCSSVILFKRFN